MEDGAHDTYRRRRRSQNKDNQLHTEHRDLDDVISRLAQSSAQDQIQLQRLKNRKLLIKDQIAMLERQLEPDIRA